VILKARGKITKDLVTPHETGDGVVLVANVDRLRVGDVGGIGRSRVNDANDGDAAVPIFYVRFGTFSTILDSTEFGPAAEANAPLWARRRIEGLGA
jgi:hypothetical protein